MTDILAALKGKPQVFDSNAVQSAFNNSFEILQRESRRSTFGAMTDKDQKFNFPKIEETASNMHIEAASSDQRLIQKHEWAILEDTDPQIQRQLSEEVVETQKNNTYESLTGEMSGNISQKSLKPNSTSFIGKSAFFIHSTNQVKNLNKRLHLQQV